MSVIAILSADSVADDDTEVRIMLAEDFSPYGEAGDSSWIPRDDVVAGLDD